MNSFDFDREFLGGGKRVANSWQQTQYNGRSTFRSSLPIRPISQWSGTLRVDHKREHYSLVYKEAFRESASAV